MTVVPYPSLAATKQAKKRDRTRFKDKVPVHTSKTSTGYDIDWQDPKPPRPKTPMTRTQFIDNLANSRNVVIT